MRRLLLCVAIITAAEFATVDPVNAFLYTTVECPPPVPDPSGQCPKGSVYKEAACVPVPRRARAWSMSPHCADKLVVVHRIARLKGRVRIVHHVAKVSALLLAGPLVDSWGRKPMLLMSIGVYALAAGMLWAVSWLGPRPGQSWAFVPLLAASFGLKGIAASVVGPATSAMVADLARHTEGSRAEGFAALGLVESLSMTAAFGAMYPLLQARLTDYRSLWGSLTLAVLASLLVAGAFLRETLPDHGDEKHLQVGSVAEKISKGLCVAWRDPFLRVLIPIASLMGTAFVSVTHLMPMYALAVFGLTSADASLQAVVLPIIGTATSVASAPLIRRLGARSLTLLVWWAVCAAMLMVACRGALPGSVAPQVLFWVGTVSFVVFGSLGHAALKTMLSSRAGPDHQGKVFAFYHLSFEVVDMVLALVWTEVLFRPEADGLCREAMFFATSGVAAVCSTLLSLAWRPELEVAESDSESEDVALVGCIATGETSTSCDSGESMSLCEDKP